MDQLVINDIDSVNIHAIEPCRSHIFKGGRSGRRFLEMREKDSSPISESIDIIDFAQFEISLTRSTNNCYEPNKYMGAFAKLAFNSLLENPLTKPNIVFFGKNCHLIGRSQGSKAILIGNDQLYFILNWSDCFGRSIKDYQLGLKKKDKRQIWYANKGTSEQAMLVYEACLAPFANMIG